MGLCGWWMELGAADEGVQAQSRRAWVHAQLEHAVVVVQAHHVGEGFDDCSQARYEVGVLAALQTCAHLCVSTPVTWRCGLLSC